MRNLFKNKLYALLFIFAYACIVITMNYKEDAGYIPPSKRDMKSHFMPQKDSNFLIGPRPKYPYNLAMYYADSLYAQGKSSEAYLFYEVYQFYNARQKKIDHQNRIYQQIALKDLR